jgi:hypothetical protein
MHRFIDEEVHAYEQAWDELKRVDHLVFVSLKYTRTVDVIKSILERMIASFECIMDGLLKEAERNSLIFEIPIAPGARVMQLKKLHANHKGLQEILTFYLFLRKLHNAEYMATREFRRNVTMTATLQDGSIEEVNIDIITDFYKKCQDLLGGVKDMFYSDKE